MSWRLITADATGALRDLDEASVHAIVTDPPYGIGFMGHEWDQPGDHAPVRANGQPAPFASGRPYPGAHVPGGQRRARNPKPSGYDRPADAKRVGSRMRFGGPTGEHSGGDGSHVAGGAMRAGRYDLSAPALARFQAWCEEWAREAMRVLKPGAHMLVSGSPRTYHRLASGIEDAGFEIRDTLCWLFGSGFPKSRDVGACTGDEAWDGWGTALKPGYEPIVLARKPLTGTIAANVLEHGVGALNIAATRIEIPDPDGYERNHSGARGHAGTRTLDQRGATDLRMGGGTPASARWPGNVILDEQAAEALDEQSGQLTSGANPTRRGSDKFRQVYGDFAGQRECAPARGLDVGGASRFFYCAKASRAERNAGLDGFPPRALLWSNGDESPGTFQSDGTERHVPNFHPTVKPIEVMRWLTRLITPAGGTVVDPFAGSGTTGVACVLENFDFVGIERDAEYVQLADARIRWWAQHEPGTPTKAILAAAAARPGADQLLLLNEEPAA